MSCHFNPIVQLFYEKKLKGRFSMYIDTHCHFWKIDRGDYSWLKPSNQTLYQDYLPEHFHSSWKKNGVEGVIAVQAAPTIEETEYLLELAEKNEQVIGVVGTLPLISKEMIGIYERLRKNPYFVGVRYTLNSYDTDQWEISEQLIENLNVMAEDGFPIDLLMKAENMPYILRLLEKVPELKIVVNHLGSPAFTDEDELWVQQITKLSQHSYANCKLSGMITQIGGYDPGKARDYVQHLVDSFGVKRLMFGSDWPVLLTAGSFDQVINLFHDVLPKSLTEAELQKIRMENAIDCYQLHRIKNLW